MYVNSLSSLSLRLFPSLFSLSCVCIKLLQSCLTLCDPVDCNLPGTSVHGILQARILEWVATPSSNLSFLSKQLNIYMQPIFFINGEKPRCLTKRRKKALQICRSLERDFLLYICKLPKILLEGSMLFTDWILVPVKNRTLAKTSISIHILNSPHIFLASLQVTFAN